MRRCLQLAALAQGNVAPNPLVGAVLVYNDKIIGEGYHQKFGEAHAEANCINSVKPEHQHLLSKAALYVSLEPCAHFGKTPPCADLIIEKKIPKVIIGCRDPFYEVNGKGIEKLQAAGVDVIAGVLENECKELNKRFFTYHTLHRPYIILKWAQSADGKMANANFTRLLISNEYTNRIVHKWRSKEAAILVGTNTALYDDPELTTRLWPGSSPVRLVVDMDLRLPASLKIFNTDSPTIIFNTKEHSGESEWKKFSAFVEGEGLLFYQITSTASIVHQIVNALYQVKIQSVLVEGCAQLLQSFIDEEMWDEARVIANEQMIVGEGLPAPALKKHQIGSNKVLLNDIVRLFYKL
ncbi:MAG: bifunctional diaminohydroxyphosphoribosylaminopyrimidine deaminase/5-amino-6-(5-phosphoribosylamino)uracil reductase RibD [Chitinophagaceae bacterium]|nr:bifunctional diaminohydroxyphosphoribosylaminopyrimidine deaminase/5-amino-6-(5-phosphoribosylamino)uracil reductase RibD [Chitinophagaceae bacterium]